MNFPFLDRRGDTVYFKSPSGKLEIYIPKEYFDEEIAMEYGDKIYTLAMFIFKYYPDMNSSSSTKYQFGLPEGIFFSYSNMEQIGTGEDVNMVFTLYDGDIFIENLKVAKDFQNTEKLVKMHFAGKLPKNVKYSDAVKLWIESMQTNNCDLGIPCLLIEAMTAELARSKGDVQTPFRKVIGKGKADELDYQPITLKKLALVSSTFMAFAGENTKNILVYSIERSRRKGSKEQETALEKIIKY